MISPSCSKDTLGSTPSYGLYSGTAMQNLRTAPLVLRTILGMALRN